MILPRFIPVPKINDCAAFFSGGLSYARTVTIAATWGNYFPTGEEIHLPFTPELLFFNIANFYCYLGKARSKFILVCFVFLTIPGHAPFSKL